MEFESQLVIQAQTGDLDAYGRLIHSTQAQAYAVAFSVLRDPMYAEDAMQEAYLRAFRRLKDLNDPAAFMSWLRRIVITVSMNMRRRERTMLLRLDDVLHRPILDEQEVRWTGSQRHALSQALVTLSPEERKLCDRRYYGQWSISRLAVEAGVDEAALRKRLQRIRDKLRKEIEMTERRDIRHEAIKPELPAKIIELLARPRLIDLPENPVGKILDLLQGSYQGFQEIELPEVVDLEDARKTIGHDALYLDPGELHHVDERRILRYDLTLPLLLSAKYSGEPLRIWTSGKVYRACQTDSTHLEAFHQAEGLWVDESKVLDPWRAIGEILKSVDAVLPGSVVRLVPTQYPMCTQAWELDIERDGQWFESVACGVFTNKIVEHLGGPQEITAVGVGYGLERLAMLRYNIDDIRKLELANV